MKRSIAAVSGTAVLLASAVGAYAASHVGTGTYKGKTSKHDPVTFKVTKGRHLEHFTHEGLRMKCPDGNNFNTDKLDSGGRKNRVSITRSGRFGIDVTYDNGGEWIARGKIKGRKATGTLRMTVRFTGADPDPHGKTVCRSGKLKFSAKRR